MCAAVELADAALAAFCYFRLRSFLEALRCRATEKIPYGLQEQEQERVCTSEGGVNASLVSDVLRQRHVRRHVSCHVPRQLVQQHKERSV